MERREFMAIMGALAALPNARAEVVAVEEWLLEPVDGDEGLRKPDLTGTLRPNAQAIIAGLFTRIGERWDLYPGGSIEPALHALLATKCGEKPSYLTEYAEAARIHLRLVRGGLDRQAAYDRLLDPADGGSSYFATRLGRVQRHVSYELISWYVSQIGFRKLGFRNYRGFIAGPFTADPPPYRRAGKP